METYGHFWGHLHGHFMEKIGFKAPGNYSGPFGSYTFSIFLWESLKLLISMISDFLGVSPSPKTNYFIFGDTRTLLKNQEKTWAINTNTVFKNPRIWEIQKTCRSSKRRAPRWHLRVTLSRITRSYTSYYHHYYYQYYYYYYLSLSLLCTDKHV